jgi:beta-1,4-mannosyl-glycoprotein beta-1,4-N-acetylglucosaminyltransferase
MAIIDVITFNGELDTLEIRLNILSPFVDKFIIVEATETFSRHPKELTFLENRERFVPWLEKIKYFVIDDFKDKVVLDMAYASDNTGNKETHWIYEFVQKEKIKDALKGLDDNDIVFVSDCDEIWNPDVLSKVTDDKVYKPKQDLTYIYYLNNRTSENWTYFTGTIVTKYKNIKDTCLNHLRTHSKNNYTSIENGGWHFNALSGADKKIDSFKHPVYTHSYMKTREKGARIDETELPEYILNNKEKYKHLFK